VVLRRRDLILSRPRCVDLHRLIIDRAGPADLGQVEQLAGLIVRVPRRRDNGSRQSVVAILVGFPDRTVPSSREDHEVFRLLDVDAWEKVATSNRHRVPPVATGTTCPTPRHHVPGPPAPRAGLEPLKEPLKEPIPPTPLRDEV